MNRSAFTTVIVCPITTRQRSSFPWRPDLRPDDLEIVANDWHAKEAWIETDQVRTLDIEARAGRHLATVVNTDKLAAIDGSLRMMLSL